MKGFLLVGLLASPCAVEVMSYNILGKGGDVEASLSLIEAADPDLLMLQEVTPVWERRLRARLGARYPWVSFHPWSGAYGFGVMSRLPLGADRLLKVSGGPALAQCMEVAAPGGPIAACNVHLKSARSAFGDLAKTAALWRQNQALRGRQWTAVEAWMQGQRGPRLVAGDMNTPGFDGLNRIIGERYRDALAALGAAEATYPVRSLPKGTVFAGLRAIPLVRLDYIWVSPEITVEAAAVVKGGGSDHFPVRARLRTCAQP